MYKIEKNVPLPADAKPNNTGKYPLADMKPGDSFLVRFPRDKAAHKKLVERVRGAVNRYRRQAKDQTFATRLTKQGIRVWRVS